MPNPRLLVFNPASLPAQDEWQSVASNWNIIEIKDLFDLRAALANDSPDCLVALGDMPEFSDALEILECVRFHAPFLPVIFYDPEMSATRAVRLIRAGADHCLGHGDSVEALRDQIAAAVEQKRQRSPRSLRVAEKREPWQSFLVGESRAMEKVVETVRMIGPRRCTVLITGDSGTGKELAARALHMASPRANHPLVTVNCSALPDNLLEAELFGHVKGAFTGAVNARIGRFEQANKGSILLDEIGDMPLDLQAKLLRVLQEREFQRLGSSETVRADVRVIAATNVNLEERIRQGRFRQDLFYRLNVVPLRMPPLAERLDDIPQLTDYFVKKICQQENMPLRRITPDAMARLQAESWPGNVRQLENAVEMALALSGERRELDAVDFGFNREKPIKTLPFRLSVTTDFPEVFDFNSAVSQFERTILERALTKTSGNKTAAAELLGIKRTTLIMKLRAFQPAMSA